MFSNYICATIKACVKFLALIFNKKNLPSFQNYTSKILLSLKYNKIYLERRLIFFTILLQKDLIFLY